MKKTILSMLLAVMAVALVSCNKASSFEKQAKKQMEKTLKEMAKNPETFQITNVETKFSNDSTCVLHIKTKGQNGFGGWSISNLEYVYFKSTNKDSEIKIREGIGDMDDEDYKSVYSTAREFYREVQNNFSNGNIKELPKGMNGKGWDNETKEYRADAIHFACQLVALSNGREVKDDNNDKDDWK